MNLIIYFSWNRANLGRRSPEASFWDLCLMNYPSRRGIRLNLKRVVGGREGSSGKLIQTTHCPPSRASLFLPSPPPSVLSTTLLRHTPSFLLERPRLGHEGRKRKRRSKLFCSPLPPIKMPRGARINPECTSIPSNVKPDTP